MIIVPSVCEIYNIADTAAKYSILAYLDYFDPSKIKSENVD